MMNKRMLIVHADDYGLTRSVSRGILKAHSEGLVTSTSVIVNTVSEKELDSLSDHPDLDVGIHLNLTKGKSLLPKEEISSLVDENGFLHKRGTSQRPVIDGFIDFSHLPDEEILVELEAQLLTLRRAGIKPSHIDTHHHIHNDQKILSAVILLAKEYNLAVRSISDSMRQMLRKNNIITTDYFESGFFGSKAITSENLISIISNLPLGTTDLMCHPGEISDELESISNYVKERETELRILTDRNLRVVIESEDVILIGWNAL